jgi:hypothetical protein
MFASRLECRSISNKVVGKIVADMKKFEFTANVMTNIYSIILIIACIYCYGIVSNVLLRILEPTERMKIGSVLSPS